MVNSLKKYNLDAEFNSIQVKAGTTSKAPFSFSTGVLKSSPVTGDYEFDGDRPYITITGNIREKIAFFSELYNGLKPRTVTSFRKDNDLNYKVNGFNSQFEPVYKNLYDSGVTISGTRDNSTQFTRSSGTWTASELIGRYAFFTDGSNNYKGSGIVTANSSTQITISTEEGSNIFTGATQVSFYPFLYGFKIQTLPSMNGSGLRTIGTDGISLFYLMGNTISGGFYSRLYKYNIYNDLLSSELSFNGDGADGITYGDLIVIGNYIWLIPYSSDYITKIDIDSWSIVKKIDITGVLTGNSKFESSVYNGKEIFMFGTQGTVKFNTITESFTLYSTAQHQDAYKQPTLIEDSQFIYLFNDQSGVNKKLYKFNTDDGTIEQLTLSLDTLMSAKFSSYDGRFIWFTSNETGNPKTVFKYDPLKNEISNISINNSIYSGIKGIIFDGSNINILMDTISRGYISILSFNPNDFNDLSNVIPLPVNLDSISNTNEYRFITIQNQLYLSSSTKLVKISNPNNRIDRNLITFDKKRIYENGGKIIKPTLINSSNTPYTLKISDYYLRCDTSTVAIGVTLPSAINFKNQIIRIKDISRNCFTNNITLTPFGSEKIEGLSSYVINSNGASIDLFSDGSNWEIN